MQLKKLNFVLAWKNMKLILDFPYNTVFMMCILELFETYSYVGLL